MASKHEAHTTSKSFASGLSAYEEFITNLQTIPVILLHYASFIVEILQFLALSFNPASTPYVLLALLHCGQEGCVKLWLLFFASIAVLITLGYLLKTRLYADSITLNLAGGMTIPSHSLIIITRVVYIPLVFIFLRVHSEFTPLSTYSQPILEGIMFAGTSAQCFPSVLSSISLLLLVIWVLLACAIYVSYCDVSIGFSHTFSAPRMVCEVIMAFCKLGAVALYVFFPVHQYRYFCNLIIGVFMLFIMIHFHPSYNPRVDHTKIAAESIYVWLAITHLLFSVISFPVWVQYIIGFAGSMIFPVFMYRVAELHYAYFAKFSGAYLKEKTTDGKSAIVFKSEHEAVLALRYNMWLMFSTHVKETKQTKDLSSKLGSSEGGLSYDSSDRVMFTMPVGKYSPLWEAAVEQFPSSSYIHFLVALNYMNAEKNFTKSLFHLKMGYQCLTPWQVDLRVAFLHANNQRYQLIFETYRENSEEFRGKLAFVKKCDVDTQRRVRLFWRMLIKDNIDSEVLFTLSEDITKAYTKADGMYKNLLRMFPTSPILLRAYATFVEDLGSEYMQAARYNELADELDFDNNPNKTSGNHQLEILSSSTLSSDLPGQTPSISSSEGSLTGFPKTGKAIARKRNIARKLASISESSFKSRAAKILTVRFGVSLLFLACTATIMFLVTGSLFGLYRENIHFLHSSGIGRHLAQKIVLGSQQLRREYFLNNSICLDKAREDINANSKKLSEMHKNLYLFQKHTVGILTDFYEQPSIILQDPTDVRLNYYDTVNLFTRKARNLSHNPLPELKASVNGTDPMNTPNLHFLLEYGPTVVSEGLSKAGSLLRDQNQVQSSTRRFVFGSIMALNIISIIAILIWVLFPIERGIMEERASVIKLFKSIPKQICADIIGQLKKSERRGFGMVTEGEIASPGFLTNKLMSYQPNLRKRTIDSVFKYSYAIGIPLLIICSFLQFSVSTNLEVTGKQVNKELYGAAERLSLTSHIHFLYSELLEVKYPILPRECYNYELIDSSIVFNDEPESAKSGYNYLLEETLLERIKATLPLLERHHYMLRFGGDETEASIGRHTRQYELLNSPLCKTLNSSILTCDNAFLKRYHLEEYGLDELFFRYLGLCRRVELQPERLAEMNFIEWLLSQALKESMTSYVAEQRHTLYKAEWNQYMIFAVNIVLLGSLYSIGGYSVATTISRSLDRCKILFLMLPESALDASPYIREFLATGIAASDDGPPISIPFLQRIKNWTSRAENGKGFISNSFTILQSLNLPFVTLTSQFRLTGVNEHFEGLLGYSSSELIGESLEVISGQSDVLQAMRELLRYGNSSVFKIKHKKGIVMSFETRILRVETQNSAYALVLECNLTPYFKESQQLNDKLAHSQGIFASIADAIIVCTAEGDILKANTLALKLFGYSEDGLIGKSLDFLIPHQEFVQALLQDSPKVEEMPLVLPNSKEGVHSNILVNKEVTGMNASGLEIPLEVNVASFRLDKTEKPEYIIVVRDMSARRKMEKDYVTAQKEKAANVAKSVFLANMSHELRTPLNGIILTSQLLGEADLTRELQEYVETIRCCAESLFALINDILDFSKIEAGKLDLEETPFDPVETVDEVVSSVSAQASEKRIELISFVDPQVPRHLSGDARRLRQVLLNLLSNAVKFTSVGHVLTTATLKGQEGDYYEILFKVSDTGIGIREEHMHQLFARFSQIDASSTRQFHGSGLGLVISKELVTMLRGKIGVESEFGRGSTFWFTCKFKFDIDSGAERSRSPDIEALEVLRLQDLMVVVLVPNLVLNDVICQYLRMWRIRSLGLDSLKKAAPYLHSRHPWPTSTVTPIWLVDEEFSDEILTSVPPNTPVMRLAFPPTIAALRSKHQAEDYDTSTFSSPSVFSFAQYSERENATSAPPVNPELVPPAPHHDPAEFTVQISKPISYKKLLEALLIALEKFPTLQKRKSAPTIVTSNWDKTNVPKRLPSIPEVHTQYSASPESSNTSPQMLPVKRLRRSEETSHTALYDFDLDSGPPGPKSQQPSRRGSAAEGPTFHIPNSVREGRRSSVASIPERRSSVSSSTSETTTDNTPMTTPLTSPPTTTPPTATSPLTSTSPLPRVNRQLHQIQEEDEGPKLVRTNSNNTNPNRNNNSETQPETNTTISTLENLHDSSEDVLRDTREFELKMSQHSNDSEIIIDHYEIPTDDAISPRSEDNRPRSRSSGENYQRSPSRPRSRSEVLKSSATEENLAQFNYDTQPPEDPTPNQQQVGVVDPGENFRNFLKKNLSRRGQPLSSSGDMMAYRWRVLLVEDNSINQKAVGTLLKKMQCEITGAFNGVEAIDAFERARAEGRPYDIVLMDCQMPVMDGYNATRNIRRLEQENNIPPIIIIAVTAHATNSDKQQCIEAGMNDYICKPLRKEHIIGMFTKWLEKKN